MARRGAQMSLAGKWEFPGGKVEVGESPEVALAREIEEELGIQIRVAELLGMGSARVGSRAITLEVYAASIVDGVLALREHAEIVWADAESLLGFDWADADVPCVPAVADWLRTARPSGSEKSVR